MATGQLSCKDCNVKFSGPLPYMDHVKSAKHLKKVAALKRLQNLLGKGDVSTASETEEAGSILRLAAAGQKDPLPFICELCNVSMNSEAALIAHNKGKKHQKALKCQEDMLRLAAETGSSGSPAEQQLSSPNSTKATSSTGTPPRKRMMDEDLSCEYCGIVLFKSFEYKLEHLETDSHCKKKSQVMGQSVGGSICEEPSSKRLKEATPLLTEAVGGSGSTSDEAEVNETETASLPEVPQLSVDEDGS